MKLQRVLKVFLFIFLSTCLYSKEYNYNTKNYKLTAIYQEQSFPGEAFFVKIIIKSKKNITLNNINASATLLGKKEISTSQFYNIQQNDNGTILLTGLPMWSWEESQNAIIKISCTINDKDTLNFNLPVIIEPKEYLKETIHLNSKLSDLIGTPNKEKKEQSRILNETLATITPSAVYETSNFIRPTTGTRITSEFGQTRTFVYSNGKEAPSYHAGLDFGIPNGTEVVSCGRGKVVMATWRIVTGYSVIVEHLPGLYSIYYHLSELKCKEGDIVEKGQLIALSGATGLATGPHLHWEIRLNTICLDPDFFVKNFSF